MHSVGIDKFHLSVVSW